MLTQVPSNYPQSPQLAVGCVVVRDDRILLVKRARPPSEGRWAVPGGRVHLGESLHAAAEREMREETGLQVKAVRPLHVFDLVQRDTDGRCEYHYVVIDMLAEYLGGEPAAGDDAAEVRWVAEADLAGLDLDPNTRKFLQDWRRAGGGLVTG